MRSPRGYDHIAGQNTNRVEALSDGVFAVALTLLVLDIKVPISDTIHSDRDLFVHFTRVLPKLLTYFMSFMTLGIFWMGHSTQFRYIERSNRNLSWITLFFLMVVSLLPFTTAFLSEHIHYRFSVVMYWFNILLCGLALLLHWNYACSNNFVQISTHERKEITDAMNRRIIVAQILYAFGAALCFFNTYVSIGFIILVQLNYALSLVTRRFRM